MWTCSLVTLVTAYVTFQHVDCMLYSLLEDCGFEESDNFIELPANDPILCVLTCEMSIKPCAGVSVGSTTYPGCRVQLQNTVTGIAPNRIMSEDHYVWIRHAPSK